MGVLGAVRRGIRAFHGSPHDFDRFSLDRIGTGEGAQAYGHGLYFAENEGVARAYRDALRFPRNDGAATIEAQIADDLNYYRGNVDAARGAYEEMARGGDAAGRALGRAKLEALDRVVNSTPGRMYEVNINAAPEEFLDWDAPPSQQPRSVMRAFRRELGVVPNYKAGSDYGLGVISRGDTGWNLYRAAVAGRRGGAQAVSEALRAAGIPGIRYLDQGSRAAGEGSRNYVVFDDSLIEILRKYGLAGLATGGGGGLLSAAMRERQAA